ncbi:MAG TPA: acyltransferase, partial [Prevotella sp.]|nr:acyltransferase [Prevotella sp.]
MIEPRPSSHRLMSIQALRGFAILLIVLSHVVGRSFDFGGESGVCLFFVISGFVLSLAYTGKVGDGLFDSKRFIVRQLVKFYPLTLVSILF